MCRRMLWSVTLGMIVLTLSGGLRMAMAQTLVLGDEPIPDSEVAVHFDFYSQESRLGVGQGLLEEGRITLGQERIYQVSKSETSDNLRRLQPPGSPPPERYLVVWPFTLYPAPGERKYQKVVFRVELADQRIKASSLINTFVN